MDAQNRVPKYRTKKVYFLLLFVKIQLLHFLETNFLKPFNRYSKKPFKNKIPSMETSSRSSLNYILDNNYHI